MNDLIVVAGATHRSGMLDEYEAQLAAAGIDFHLWPLDPLPAGANSINMARRIAYIRAVAERFSDQSKIVMTDAWDVMFFGTREEVIEKVPENGVFVSTERNCYPEPHLASKFTAASAWRFMNNGMLCGSPKNLLAFAELASTEGDLSILDQAWFNRNRVSGHPFFGADEYTMLFYVVSATQEDGALQMKNGRPWNTRYDTFPCFLHFSGQCPTDRFRAMLRGEVPAL